MKIALYIDSGLEQIVLTPQTDTEHALLKRLHDGTRDFSIHRGGFYECSGGWVRHGEEEYQSTLIVMRPQPDRPRQSHEDAMREALEPA